MEAGAEATIKASGMSWHHCAAIEYKSDTEIDDGETKYTGTEDQIKIVHRIVDRKLHVSFGFAIGSQTTCQGHTIAGNKYPAYKVTIELGTPERTNAETPVTVDGIEADLGEWTSEQDLPPYDHFSIEEGTAADFTEQWLKPLLQKVQQNENGILSQALHRIAGNRGDSDHDLAKLDRTGNALRDDTSLQANAKEVMAVCKLCNVSIEDHTSRVLHLFGAAQREAKFAKQSMHTASSVLPLAATSLAPNMAPSQPAFERALLYLLKEHAAITRVTLACFHQAAIWPWNVMLIAVHADGEKTSQYPELHTQLLRKVGADAGSEPIVSQASATAAPQSLADLLVHLDALDPNNKIEYVEVTLPRQKVK